MVPTSGTAGWRRQRVEFGPRVDGYLSPMPAADSSDSRPVFYRPLIELEPYDAAPGARSAGTGVELIRVGVRRVVFAINVLWSTISYVPALVRRGRQHDESAP